MFARVRTTAALALLSMAAAHGQPAPITYPKAETYFVDTYFGTKVADPYRWLEDPDSTQSREWINAQNAITFPYLESIPQRSVIRERLTELWNFERYSTPSKDGGKYFYSYNTGLQNQSVLFVADAIDTPGRVLLDPNTLRQDGTAALAGVSVSEDGKYMAYAIADAGSDWTSWKIRDIATGKDLEDSIRWVKFSGASWLHDSSGFLYSRYDEPKAGQEYTAANHYPKVYLHTLGQAQSKNVLVYERPDQKEWGLSAGVTEDGQYVVMSVWKGTNPKNGLFVRDLKANPIGAAPTEIDTQIRGIEREIRGLQDQIDSGGDMAALGKQMEEKRAARAALVAKQGNTANGFIELLSEFDASYEYVGNDGQVFYFSTNFKAPKSRLIAVDLGKPGKDNWREIIPEAAETLQGVTMVGNTFFASYLKDAKTQVKQFDRAGKLIREVALPGIGTASGFGGKRADNETFYSFTSYNIPTTIYRLNAETGESTLWKQPAVKFNPDDFVVTQKFYASKDGTRVPMFIVHKKGIKLDGNNPVLLYGYGGFNISLTPSFSPAIIGWLEMGGVYAVPNIRGGGEYGEEWHQAGTSVRKQNVFDDFIAAAEFLIAEKYTKAGRIACSGGSNGGLLVGAMITQRPELWGAALPAVGVLDMLRFHKFTIGWAWKSDYGCAETSEEEFKALNAYSPYHVALRKPGSRWPATMITTGDHDDRVVPAHSFKFAAALQATQAGDKPVLIRIDVRAGHGAGKPTAKRIEEVADQYAFLVKNLGMK
jgi:prolyl oligopeptidase